MNYKELFYKPRRLAKKTKFQKIRTYAIFLSIVTTLGVASFIVSKYSSNKRNSEEYSSFSLEDYDVVYKKLLSDKLSDVNNFIFDYMEEIREEQIIMEESITEEDIITDIIENLETPEEISFRENVVLTARAVREALKDIPNEVKYEYVLDHYLMTPFQFDVIQAISGKEGKPGKNRYEDTFFVITSGYNRMRSYTKCGYCRDWLHKSGYITLYEHFTAPGQYSTYKAGNGTYRQLLGVTSGEHYQAVLDFLYVADVLTETCEYVNPYLDFLASGHGYPGSVHFVPGGNEFSYKQPSSDRIPLEDLYYYANREDFIQEEELLYEEVEDNLVLDEEEVISEITQDSSTLSLTN